MSRVLIIEDDVFLSDDLKYFVEEKGHTCEVFRYADSVVENFDKIAQFDCIILDLMMLKGKYLKDDISHLDTGEILFKKIRKKYTKIKIIILTAKMMDSINVDFEHDSVVVMIKPLTEEKIEKLIDLL